MHEASNLEERTSNIAYPSMAHKPLFFTILSSVFTLVREATPDT